MSFVLTCFNLDMRLHQFLPLAFGVAGAVATLVSTSAQSDLAARARALHKEAPLIDGHNDYPWALRERDGGGDFNKADITEPVPSLMTDIPRLRRGGLGAQFWSVYVPAEMQGRSFLPLTRGERAGWPAEVFVQISESQVGRAIRTERWTYSVSAPDRDAWDDAASDRYVEEFLYDLQADPHEMTNLADSAEHRDTLDALRARLADWRRETGDTP